MIQAIRKEGSRLVLEYDSDRHDNSWVHDRLEKDSSVSFKRTFHFTAKSLLEGTLGEWGRGKALFFELGVLDGDYFRIDKDILDTTFDVFLHRDLTINIKCFCAPKNVSIFRKFNELIADSLYIGGDREGALPKKSFEQLIRFFPNEYELTKYVEARISAVISTYVETKKDSEANFTRLMNKKGGRVGSAMMASLKEYELNKYELLLAKLKQMLTDENSYSEDQWQKEILEIILLIHPKYIKAFEKVSIRDVYNQKRRELDILLVDSSGHVDFVEIKKPFDKCIVTEMTYRDNHIPLRELSGTVMQIEKYIFYLNKWGKKGEETLTQNFENELPEGLKIKIVNPKALIIMGRDNELTAAQKEDFEIIKRQYHKVFDIITYDDLIARLECMIKQLQAS